MTAVHTTRAGVLALLGGGAAMVLLAACSGGDDPSGTGGQGGTGQGGATSVQGGSGGSGGPTAPSSYPNLGVCGARGSATADPTSFDGYEERFIISEQGFGSDVCVVRLDLVRVGDAPGGCVDCTWSQLLEYRNPRVTTDTDGVCAKSDLALDAAAVAKLAGTRVALGFAKELGGAHGSARMLYSDTLQIWEVAGNATWDATTKAFKFDYRDGLCGYGP